MKIDLTGKKALVGGSSKGIGLGIATELVNSGASVCLMARNESRLKEIVSQLPDSNNHSYLVVDFSKFEDFKIKIEEYVKKTGVSYLDAVMEYCTENKIEPETVASLISKPLKEKIEVDAMKLNLLPKVSQLPLLLLFVFPCWQVSTSILLLTISLH